MKYATLDFSNNPFVIVRVSSIDPTDQQFEEYIKELTKALTEMENGFLIYQLSEAKFLPATKRIKLSNWIKNHTELMKKNMVGICFVNTGFIAMTVLKGIMLTNKPPIPYAVLSSENEAFAWAEKMINNLQLKK